MGLFWEAMEATGMDRGSSENASTATIEELLEDPRAVVERAFEHGEVVVKGDRPEDGMRLVAQSYDIEPE